MKTLVSFSKNTLITLALLGSALAFSSQAKAYIEFNGFYASDGLTNDSTTTSSRMFVEGSIGFGIDRNKRYLVGWNYSMHSTADKGTTEVTYSSTQMGPRFIYIIDRMKKWSLGLGYYLVTKATYNQAGGNEETWKGTALKADIGYNYPISETFFAGLRLNYSSATYNEKLVGSTTYSEISYTRSLMYPSVYFFYLF